MAKDCKVSSVNFYKEGNILIRRLYLIKQKCKDRVQIKTVLKEKAHGGAESDSL